VVVSVGQLTHSFLEETLAIVSFLEETLAIVFATLRPIDLHAVFIRHRLEKLMTRPCSGKPQSESVLDRGDVHFGVGLDRALWGGSWRLAKLSRNCE
jgi:hypothetical protein